MSHTFIHGLTLGAWLFLFVFWPAVVLFGSIAYWMWFERIDMTRLPEGKKIEGYERRGE